MVADFLAKNSTRRAKGSCVLHDPPFLITEAFLDDLVLEEFMLVGLANCLFQFIFLGVFASIVPKQKKPKWDCNTQEQC